MLIHANANIGYRRKKTRAINYEWRAKLRKCHLEPKTYDE